MNTKHTPMIGRTHGVHAEVMTFGLKLPWYAEPLGATTSSAAREAVHRQDLRWHQHVHLDPSIEADPQRIYLMSAPISPGQ